MKSKILLLLIFFVAGSPGFLYGYDEVQLIKNFLKMPYSVELVKTDKEAVNANAKFNPYLKNPSFSMGIEKSFDDSSYAFKFADLGFEFDVSGKYFLEKDLSRLKKLRAEEQVKVSVVESVANFRTLLAKLFYLSRKKEILKSFEREIAALLKELSILVEGKSNSKFDLMRIDSLFLSHKRKILEIDAEIVALRSQLKSLCGIEIDELSLQIPELIEFEKIKATAFSENPKIKEAVIHLSQSEKEITVEKRKRVPDPGLGIGFIQEKFPGADPGYSINIEINFDLPFFDFNRKEVSAAVYENQQKKMDLLEKKFFMELHLTELYRKADYLTKGFVADQNKDYILKKSFLLYRAGEISVSDLILTLYEIEELHFSEIELKENIHALILQLYTVAGFFENEKINDLIAGAVK